MKKLLCGNNAARIPNIKNKSLTKNFETGKGYQLMSRGGGIVLICLTLTAF